METTCASKNLYFQKKERKKKVGRCVCVCVCDEWRLLFLPWAHDERAGAVGEKEHGRVGDGLLETCCLLVLMEHAYCVSRL